MTNTSNVPRSQHVYLQHLLHVGRTHRVTSACAFIASGGGITLREGVRLGAAEVQSLAGINLAENLLHLFHVHDALNASTLYDAIVDYLQSDKSLEELFNIFHMPELVRRFCREINNEPTVMQLLTVLKICYPRIFEQGVFVAWFAMVALQTQAPEDELFELFYAGLVHDLGVLFVEPTAVKREPRSPEDWLEWQQHANYSGKMIEHLPSIPYPTLRAVVEHHERLDGSGFPLARIAKQLNWRGQLVQLLDSCYAVYTRHFKPRGRTLSDIIPIIQMNAPTRADRAANALIMALKEGSGTTSCSVPDGLISMLIRCVKDRHDYIRQVLELGMALNDSVGLVVSNARLFALQNTLEYIDIAMTQSGLINAAYMRWLDQVEKEKLTHAYREVEDVFLMMQEVLYHIGRYKTQLYLCMEAPAVRNLKDQIEEIARAINAVPVPDVPAAIAAFWQQQPLRT